MFTNQSVKLKETTVSCPQIYNGINEHEDVRLSHQCQETTFEQKILLSKKLQFD